MKKIYILLIIIGVLIMLKPINTIIKDSIGNIVFRGNVVTGIIATNHSDGSYDVFISESDKAYPKVRTLSQNPDLAVGDKVRILYKDGCRELPIILPPVKSTVLTLYEKSTGTAPSSWPYINIINKKMMQSFMAISDHNIDKISIIIGKRNATNLGTITLGIYVVDGSGLPTGSALTSGTVDGNTIPDWGSEIFVDFIVTQISIINGTQYAIQIICDAFEATQHLEWGLATDIYVNGKFDRYNGSTWENYNSGNSDGRFRIYGY